MPPRKVNGCKRKDGYILVTVGGKRKFQHRQVMEEFLKRPLHGEENVHHLNHDRSDNRLENLKLYATRAEHTREEGHKPRLKYDPNDSKKCVGCAKLFYRYEKKHKFKKRIFCSHPCYLKNLKRTNYGLIVTARPEVEHSEAGV